MKLVLALLVASSFSFAKIWLENKLPKNRTHIIGTDSYCAYWVDQPQLPVSCEFKSMNACVEMNNKVAKVYSDHGEKNKAADLLQRMRCGLRQQ